MTVCPDCSGITRLVDNKIISVLDDEWCYIYHYCEACVQVYRKEVIIISENKRNI